MAGRPSKLTPELQERIISAIRAGNYMETAAAYAGISKDTLYRWLKQGARAKSGPYKRFSDAIAQAMAQSEVRDVAVIHKAAETEWTAAAWRLERKYPERWGRRQKVEAQVSGPGGGPVEVTATVNLAALTDEELEQLEQLATKASASANTG